MYDILYDEIDEFGWEKITKPIVVTSFANTFLPEESVGDDGDRESPHPVASEAEERNDLQDIEDTAGLRDDDWNVDQFDEGSDHDDDDVES